VSTLTYLGGKLGKTWELPKLGNAKQSRAFPEEEDIPSDPTQHIPKSLRSVHQPESTSQVHNNHNHYSTVSIAQQPIICTHLSSQPVLQERLHVTTAFWPRGGITSIRSKRWTFKRRVVDVEVDVPTHSGAARSPLSASLSRGNS